MYTSLLLISIVSARRLTALFWSFGNSLGYDPLVRYAIAQSIMSSCYVLSLIIRSAHLQLSMLPQATYVGTRTTWRKIAERFYWKRLSTEVKGLGPLAMFARG